jgi:hypothetical protein
MSQYNLALVGPLYPQPRGRCATSLLRVPMLYALLANSPLAGVHSNQ